MHATLTSGAACEAGTGVSFDGIDDGVTLNAVPLGGAMTMSFWAKFDSFSDYDRLAEFSDTDSDVDQYSMIYFGLRAGDLKRYVGGGLKTAQGQHVGFHMSPYDPEDEVSQDVWTHFTMTVDLDSSVSTAGDAGNGRFKLYKDGLLM
jgi:hypothetical protein